MTWTTGEWIAFGSLGVGIVGAIGMGIGHAIKVSYRFGRTDQEQDEIRKRLDKVEARTDGADEHQSAMKVLQGVLDGLKEQVAEMRRDIKDLMTGHVRPRCRSEGE